MAEQIARCENDLHRLAAENPGELLRQLTSGEMEPTLLTFAAEIAGNELGPRAVPALISLLEHPKPYVREGAIYGLLPHLWPSGATRVNVAVADHAERVFRALSRVGDLDECGTVREIARECIDESPPPVAAERTEFEGHTAEGQYVRGVIVEPRPGDGHPPVAVRPALVRADGGERAWVDLGDSPRRPRKHHEPRATIAPQAELEPHPSSSTPTTPQTGPDQALAALHASRRAIREAQALARVFDGLGADDRARFLDLLAADLPRLPRPDKEGVWWMWDGETWELVRVSFHCSESVCLLEFFGTDDTLELDAFPPDVQFTPAYTFRPPPLPRKAP